MENNKTNDMSERGIEYQKPRSTDKPKDIKDYLKQMPKSSGLVQLMFEALDVKEKNRFVEWFKEKILK